ncbi:MAG: hypothetical protein PHC33_00630 [Candidatus Omnitrophica bacterium]|nr:hypothetical protein [Candidatus Omnitrophota bacterium]
MFKGIIKLTWSGFFLFILLFYSVNGFSYEIEPLDKKLLSKEKSALNLVFCPLNYPDKEAFQKDTQGLIARLKRTKPFDELSVSFSIWQVNFTGAEAVQVFKPTQGFPPLKVRNDLLAYISSKLKSREYKFVIIDAKGSTSCAELSSIEKTSLIILGKARYKGKNRFAKGFLHELGHSLGLYDECVDCAQLSSGGYPNCAATKEEAQEWWGDLVSKDSRVNFISGCCGNKYYLRPTIASLMNDPDKAKDFGPVNERYLKKVLNPH